LTKGCLKYPFFNNEEKFFKIDALTPILMGIHQNHSCVT